MRSPSWMEPISGVGDWIAVTLGALVVLGIAAVVALLLSGSITDADIDYYTCLMPNEPCRESAYRVTNDTSTAVLVRECLNHCGKGDERLEPVTILPGRTTGTEYPYPIGADVGLHTWFEVLTVSGRRRGCLVLDGHRRKHDGDRVVISAATPCRTSALPTRST